MAYRSFEELDVWKQACRLAVEVHRGFRGSKEYTLRDQVFRSAVSIASNIAEGAERNSIPEFRRFLHIAKGSSAELRTQLYIAIRIGELNEDEGKRMVEETRSISARLQALTNALTAPQKPNTSNVKPKT